MGTVSVMGWVHPIHNPYNCYACNRKLVSNSARPKMRFSIDSFYHDATYGVVKFVGYKEGNLLFDRYEKSFERSGHNSGWKTIGQRVNIDPKFQDFRLKRKRIRPILPPE